MIDPAELAKAIVTEVLVEGAKTHGGEDWRAEPTDKHLDKGLRHVLTWRLMRDGHQKPDGEDHLKNALTRLAMAAVTRETGITAPAASRDIKAILWVTAALALFCFSIYVKVAFGFNWLERVLSCVR